MKIAPEWQRNTLQVNLSVLTRILGVVNVLIPHPIKSYREF